MIRKLDLLYFTALFVGLLPSTGCNRHTSSGPEIVAKRQEAQRLQEQTERAALVERMKAAAIAEEIRQEPIRNLQMQIDALDEQISDAWSRGKDCKALEIAQDALEAQKYELQHK